MKKLVLVVLALMFCVSVAYADQQYASNGTNVGIATKTNVVGATVTRSGQTATITVSGNGQALTPATVAATSGITFQSTVQASGQNTGVTNTISPISPNITSAMLAYGLVKLNGSSAASAHIGLANGVPGQMVTIQCGVYQGQTIVIGTTYGIGVTCSGFSTITFTAALQSVTLLWLDNTSGWIVVGNAGTTIA